MWRGGGLRLEAITVEMEEMVMFFYELMISLKNYISYYLGRPRPETTQCLRKSSLKKSQLTGAKKFINVAVTGLVDSGKSTLIDAIRSAEDEEEEAARPIGKCEAIPLSYAYQDNPKVLLWDLPGIEGNEARQRAYLEKADLRAYDFFIIVSSTRVSEELLYLAKEIEKMGRHFFFVRSKIDVYVRNTKQQNFNQGDLLRVIRKHFVKKLQGIGIKFPRVFLLSALHKDKFDFPDFLEAFNNEF